MNADGVGLVGGSKFIGAAPADGRAASKLNTGDMGKQKQGKGAAALTFDTGEGKGKGGEHARVSAEFSGSVSHYSSRDHQFALYYRVGIVLPNHRWRTCAA